MIALIQSALRSKGNVIKQQIRHKYNMRKWREVKKLPTNPNSFGPLTNLPDYSFKDGRPVPYGVNQKGRIDKEKENFRTIQKLVGEIDMAVIKHEQRKKLIEEKEQKILDSKLKEKGVKLMISSSENQAQDK